MYVDVCVCVCVYVHKCVYVYVPMSAIFSSHYVYKYIDIHIHFMPYLCMDSKTQLMLVRYSRTYIRTYPHAVEGGGVLSSPRLGSCSEVK